MVHIQTTSSWIPISPNETIKWFKLENARTQYRSLAPSSLGAVRPEMGWTKKSDWRLGWLLSEEEWVLKELFCFDNRQNEITEIKLYRVLVNVIIIRHLGRVEEVEEAFTLFSFGYWLSVLSSLLWLLFQDLLCQVLSSNPLNLRPGYKNGIRTWQNITVEKIQKKLLPSWRSLPDSTL